MAQILAKQSENTPRRRPRNTVVIEDLAESAMMLGQLIAGTGTAATDRAWSVMLAEHAARCQEHGTCPEDKQRAMPHLR
jgi:hypothetical protein